jgi:hypothetical protein
MRNPFFLLTALLLTALAQPCAASRLSADISFSASLDLASEYFYRGILQEDQGLIVQPAASVTFAVAESKWKPTISAGIWNSLHSNSTNASPTTGHPSWYELDTWVALSLSPLNRLRFEATWTSYSSPSHAFATVDEIALDAYFDDSNMWDGVPFAFNPYLSLAVELDGTAFGTDEGAYLELGVVPTMAFENDQIIIKAPARVGVSLNRYYESAAHGNQGFGFVSVGLAAESPWIGDTAFGSVTLKASVEAMALGPSLSALNSGRDFTIGLMVGVALSF